MSTLLRVLIVEDSEDDAVLLARHIKRSEYDIVYKRVDNAEAMNVALNDQLWDIVISDYSMPMFNGIAALKIFQKRGIDIPFIIVSGTIGEDIAVEAMKAGAHDYVMKGNLARLIPAIQRELHDAVIRRERRQTEEALRDSEKRFREMFDDAPVGYHELDAEGRFTRINKTELEMLGYTAEEMIGQEAWKFVADAEITQQRIFAKLAGTMPPSRGAERLYNRKGQKPFPVLIEDRLLRDHQGKIVGIRTIIQDITARKHAEEALRESEDRYRKLFEDSKDAIYMSTVDGKFLDINQAGVELFGYGSKEELLKANIEEDIYFDRVKRSHTKDIIRTEGFIKDYEQTLKRKDGKLIFVLETTTPVRNAQGNVVIFRGILRDITMQKQLEQQFIQAQKMESIGTLAGGIAHDFNNILGIILGYSNLLMERRKKPKEFLESIQAINQAVERGAALVSQILTFARKTDIAFLPVNLADLARELLSMLTQTFPKAITWKGSFPKNIPDIYADRTQIHQVLLNLCVNARDAMPRGGQITLKTEIQSNAQVRTRCPAADQEKYVCLSVADTGKGMDEATRLRVFDPFFTTKQNGKGMGLGLSVVYGVVQSHHSFIEVESKLGSGTTFRIYFPIPVVERQATESQKKKKPVKISGTETILFIEDEDLLATMVRHILESKGYTIHVAKNNNEAIALFKRLKDKVALVLMDLGLPEKTGLDEFKELKKIHPKVKVVFASGFFESQTKSDLLKAGAKGFIQKPFTLENILQTLRTALDEEKT
jgi:PAS domain S-box-containing protein